MENNIAGLKFLALYCFFAIVACSVLLPWHASAHVLKTDKNIGVVMHMVPDDDPRVGETTTIYFEVKDKENMFRPGACDCSVLINDASSTVLSSGSSSPLKINNSSLFMDVVFPHEGTYTVNLYGQSRATTIAAFKPFTLSYEVSVGTARAPARFTAVHSLFSKHLFHIIMFGIGFIVVCFVIFRDEKKLS